MAFCKDVHRQIPSVQCVSQVHLSTFVDPSVDCAAGAETCGGGVARFPDCEHRTIIIDRTIDIVKAQYLDEMHAQVLAINERQLPPSCNAASIASLPSHREQNSSTQGQLRASERNYRVVARCHVLSLISHVAFLYRYNGTPLHSASVSS